ncbi:hypothetical protein F5X68DRAFT_198473 [Plectosphaerella plurivora]|uniref:Uncharacterized protein n=1 Tax=Plectosphaerella plurivora TaxID=936078 RepID=A0A9P8VK80_9PEZI|nr:hypothetical protein F5X68DRAFT_198473 [Plectosphaerella plurivora]
MSLAPPMSLAVLLRWALRLLLPLAVLQTLYLYTFPVFIGCAFPLPSDTPLAPSDAWPAFLATARQHVPLLSVPPRGAASTPAPFRLLAIGDPQLEGDTSIPNTKGPRLPHFKKLRDHLTFRSSHGSLLKRTRQFFHDYVDALFEDIPNELESVRKHIDLFGNDFYLAHIYRTVHWWTKPTHVTVLGDLVGSQWIKDEEFERRGSRFWNRVFRNAERVPDELMTYPAMDYELAAMLGDDSSAEAAAWSHRAINVVGNHDIGYAGDITKHRLARFERVFGRANYELRFELPLGDYPGAAADNSTPSESDNLPPELRIVILNDMNLDTPVQDSELQDATYTFINDVIKTSTAVEYNGHFTVVLTHIPLFKPEGVCVDSPFFSFHDNNQGVKEQNLLSGDASRGFLEGIFGMSGDPKTDGGGRGRPGVILNGHDHEGCDIYHYIRQSAPEDDRFWDVKRWPEALADGNATIAAEGVPGIREITVRSIMGDFGGNTGLLSAWFDRDSWSWRFEYDTCALGTQHFWWAVHIVDLIVVVFAIAYGVVLALSHEDAPAGAASKHAVSKPISSDGAIKMSTSPQTPFRPGHEATPPRPTEGRHTSS